MILHPYYQFCIGLAVEVCIGLVVKPPAVDFIIQNGWISRNQILRNAVFPRDRGLVLPFRQKEIRRDNSELQEMMGLYSQWRKAA